MTSLHGVVPGVVVGNDFRIIGPLSEGGMGAVFVAEQLSTGKQRALKVMQPSLVSDQRLRERFVQEARIGARIESEHIVEVVGAGIDAALGSPWIAMELLKGETLAGRVRRSPLSVAEAREVFDQLSHALATAHDAGVVHRDLKPENIFLAASRRRGSAFTVKVLDFGIAKIVAEAKTRSTAPMGTALWMAPEQTEAGRGVDPTTDVWALGLIAFHVLTGHFYWRSPYVDNASPMTMVRELVVDPLPPLEIRAQELGVDRYLPNGFHAWFARCVDRAMERRFANAREALDVLDRVLAGNSTAIAPTYVPPVQTSGTMPMHAAPIPVEPPKTTGAAVGMERAPEPPTSRTPTMVIAIVGVVALVGGIALAISRSQSPPAPASSPSEVTKPKVDTPPEAPPPKAEPPQASAPTPTASAKPEASASAKPPPEWTKGEPTTKSPVPSASPPGEPTYITPSPAAPPVTKCSEWKGDYIAAMRAKEYDCVRSFLLPRLNSGSITSGEARYLKAACMALGDVACEKRAAEKI